MQMQDGYELIRASAPETVDANGFFQQPSEPSLTHQVFNRDATLFTQGSPVREVYYVVEGLVKLVCSKEGGGEVIAGMARPGDWLGETSVVLGTVYPMTAVAVACTTVCRFSADNLLQLIRTDVQFAQSLNESLSRQLQSQHIEVVMLRSLSGRQRLEWLLRTFLLAQQSVPSPGTVFPLPLSIREMAELTFTSQQHVESLLGDFERRGIIRRERHDLTICRTEFFLGADQPQGGPMPDPARGGFSAREAQIAAHGNVHASVLAAMRLIEERHGDCNLKLSSLSRELNISVWYLARLFKRECGCGFREYLKSVRIRTASDHLLNKALSIKEIAGAVGYMHVSDFNHHFKAVHGISPTQYRRRLASKSV